MSISSSDITNRTESNIKNRQKNVTMASQRSSNSMNHTGVYSKQFERMTNLSHKVQSKRLKNHQNMSSTMQHSRKNSSAMQGEVITFSKDNAVIDEKKML